MKRITLLLNDLELNYLYEFLNVETHASNDLCDQLRRILLQWKNETADVIMDIAADREEINGLINKAEENLLRIRKAVGLRD